MPEHVQRWLEGVRDLPCGPVLQLFVEQVTALDPAIETEVGAFGLHFRIAGSPLCEISVFGQLFIARVGREQAVEYRVRRHDGVVEALDRILRELQQAAPRTPEPA
jgi:hypothetical protein